jgi:hypothetical protein
MQGAVGAKGEEYLRPDHCTSVAPSSSQEKACDSEQVEALSTAVDFEEKQFDPATKGPASAHLHPATSNASPKKGNSNRSAEGDRELLVDLLYERAHLRARIVAEIVKRGEAYSREIADAIGERCSRVQQQLKRLEARGAIITSRYETPAARGCKNGIMRRYYRLAEPAPNEPLNIGREARA